MWRLFCILCSFFALGKGVDGLMNDGMNVIQLFLRYGNMFISRS